MNQPCTYALGSCLLADWPWGSDLTSVLSHGCFLIWYHYWKDYLATPYDALHFNTNLVPIEVSSSQMTTVCVKLTSGSPALSLAHSRQFVVWQLLPNKILKILGSLFYATENSWLLFFFLENLNCVKCYSVFFWGEALLSKKSEVNLIEYFLLFLFRYSKVFFLLKM